MLKNKLFEQIVNQKLSNQKLNEETNRDFLDGLQNKLIDLFDTLYKNTDDPDEWASIVSAALEDSIISAQDIDALRDRI